jgi:hypothetical protein
MRPSLVVGSLDAMSSFDSTRTLPLREVVRSHVGVCSSSPTTYAFFDICSTRLVVIYVYVVLAYSVVARHVRSNLPCARERRVRDAFESTPLHA